MGEPEVEGPAGPAGRRVGAALRRYSSHRLGPEVAAALGQVPGGGEEGRQVVGGEREVALLGPLLVVEPRRNTAHVAVEVPEVVLRREVLEDQPVLGLRLDVGGEGGRPEDQLGLLGPALSDEFAREVAEPTGVRGPELGRVVDKVGSCIRLDSHESDLRLCHLTVSTFISDFP